MCFIDIRKGRQVALQPGTVAELVGQQLVLCIADASRHIQPVSDCDRSLEIGGFRCLAIITAGLLSGKIRKLGIRSEEHTSELQSLMRISYAVFCLKQKKDNNLKRYI